MMSVRTIAEDSAIPFCPWCGCQTMVMLGVLGHVLWLRCRDCGCEVQAHVDPESGEDVDNG